MRTRARVIGICTIVAALAAVFPLAVSSSPAFASGDATVSGVVTDALGDPLAGISVSAFGSNGNGQATTAADGSYTITGLGTDAYSVVFIDPSRVYSPEWWNHQPDRSAANAVSVTLGDAVTGIDAALSRTSISGVVTNASAQPLAGVRVHAYGLQYDALTTTAADGSYNLSALGGDTYRVYFEDPASVYSPEWWNKQPDYLSATAVSVSLGDTITGIDPVLSLTTISGVVTDESGQPLAGVQVNAFGLIASPVATTGADGSYTLTGVSPDTYRIQFTGAGYSPEWWSNQPDYSTAAFVTVGFGDAVTGIDAQLAVTTISGRVTDTSAQPIAGVQVAAYGTFNVAQATTGPDGSYTLPGLGVDTYRISFFDPASGVTEWWSDKPDYSTADTITVAFDDMVTGIDQTLAGTSPPDTTAPSISLVSPPDGSSYTLDQVVTASYTCTDTGGPPTTTSTTSTSSPFATTTTTTTMPFATTTTRPSVNAPGGTTTDSSPAPSTPASSCVGTVPSGAAIDTSTAGPHVFTVDAADGAGNSASKTVGYTVRAGDVNQVVSGGDIVSTDPGQLGPSPSVPVQTRIAVPDGVAGTITVASGPVGAPTAGFVLFGTQLALTGPAAPTAASPYVVTFAIDASVLAGISPDDVQVFRNGVAVLDCTDAASAIPDPCVAARGPVPDLSGDAFITVRTTQFSAWTVGRRLIGVDEVNPNAKARGVSHAVVAVRGVGFVNGSSVAFAGGGITVNSTSFVDTSHLSADISISNSAALGPRVVRVTNPGVNPPTATCAQCFAVTAKPAITALSPNARPQGAANQNITIVGTNFEAGAGVTISGSGVSVNSVSGSGTSLAIDLSVSGTAPPGPRDVTVTNPDGGVATKNSAFTVNARPIVTSTVPSAVTQGVTATIQLLGSNFGSGSTVSFGLDISVSSVVRNSASKLTARIVVGAHASTGARAVTVVNPDGGAGACAGCLTVNSAPTINSVAPASRPQGASHQLITVTGTGFPVGAGVSISGGGIIINSVTRNGPTSLAVNVSISNNAATGPRDVTVSSPGGPSVTCAGCFTVNARPTITGVTPSSKPRGGSYSIVVAGQGFQTDAAVSFSGGGIDVNSIAGSATTLTVNITIASNATKGNRDVTVTNPDTGAATATNAFKVT